MQDRRAQFEPDGSWRYILSAGRTGTVFMQSFLRSNCPDMTVVHEPSPSRQHLVAANFHHAYGIGGKLLAHHFNRSRVMRLHAAGGRYIEINPFLCSLVDLLPDVKRPLRVVHVVRAPETWTASIMGFKASTKFRSIIDYIPFATPYPSPRPDNWSDMPRIEKALWRWQWCNSQILGLKERCASFTTVRYEDIFSENQDQRDVALSAVLSTLDISCATTLDAAALAQRHNKAPENAEQPSASLVKAVCGELAHEFGYKV